MPQPPILILGEFPSEAEVISGHPFTGPSGAELIRILAESGLISLTPTHRESLRNYYTTSDPTRLQSIWSANPFIHLANTFTTHPAHNNPEFFCGPKTSAIPGYPPLLKSKYVQSKFEPELDRLCNEILTLDPNIIICLGNIPLWALTGKTGIKNIRGTTLLSHLCVADYKLLPTYHPSIITRDWSLRPTVIADFMKAKSESAFPDLRRPPREIWIEPTLDDIQTFFNTHIRGCDILSTDIETSGVRITCIGFAPSSSLAIVIPFDDGRAKSGSYWPTREDERRVWDLVRSVLEDGSIRKLFQNGAYDISFLWRAYGIKTFGATEDTMLLSHALQPESLKGLGYLGSIFSRERSWKHMRAKAETIKKDA